MAKITLTLDVTDAEQAALVARFIETATAVAGGDDEGPAGDPNGSKVDAVGVIWDARYHGAALTKNQDGTWRRKKNLSAQEKTDADAYEAGCRGASTAAHAAAGVPATTIALQQGDAVARAPAADVPAFLQTGAFTPPTAAPIMGLPGMPVAVPAPPAPISYPELITAFQTTAERIGMERLQNVELQGVYARAGIVTQADLAQLETNEDVRRKVKTELDALV
jgi:hypothetical protein